MEVMLSPVLNKKIKIEEEVPEPNINLFKPTPFETIEKVDYVEPTEAELKSLEGTKNPTEQLKAEADEILPPTDDRKMFIDMVKVIALVDCGHQPLDNPSNFYRKEKEEVISKMEQLVNLPYIFIKNKFNEICTKQIFTPGADYSQIPVIPITLK
jgi:hypothetical protein